MEMNDAQKQAFNRASEILREHFNASLLVVMADEERDGVDGEGTFIQYHGGNCCALGLATLASHRILRLSPRTS